MNFKTNSIDSNLGKLYLLRGLAFAWFPIPTIILFYQSHGLDLEQAVWLKTILSLSILILEVPSGYIADKLGRKFCLVAGSAVWIVGWLCYCVGSSFAVFAIAEILAGVAGSLISGANTALVYETLIQLGKESHYRTIEGKLVAVAGISEALCGLVGAAVAEINLAYPFYLQTACLFVYFCIALTLIEPKGGRIIVGELKTANLKSIIVDVFVKRPRLRWLILLSGTFATASFLMVWLSQGYLEQINFPIVAMGVAWAIFHLLMSLASFNASKIETAWGMKKTVLILVWSVAVAYILLGSTSNSWGIALIAVIYMVRGLCSPLILNLINEQIPSTIRATVLSLNSFTFRLGFAIVAPIIGAITSSYSLSLGLFVVGWFFLIAGSFCWWRLVRLQVIK